MLARMKVDLSPLLRGQRGETIRIAGVGVGSAASAVERSALTGAEDDGADEPRMYGDGTVHRKGPAGEWVEIPLAERVEATLRSGGCLRCGDIALRVKAGLIERIFVRGPSLASLDISQEDAIARRFGPAAGHERFLGSHVHHYPDRGLVVAWSDRDHRLEYVALGEQPWSEPRLGAKELLSELLDAFDELAPLRWEEPRDGSARVRHQRVAALARALGLGSVADVAEGNFLDRALDAGRIGVLAEIAAQAPLARDNGPLRHGSADRLFSSLLHYRHDVHRVVRATSGWLLCSDPALLGMIALQNRLGNQLDAMMADVDRYLSTLLDPDHRTFERRALIAQHGWPDVDLNELEDHEL
jgi:hypothetical protein